MFVFENTEKHKSKHCHCFAGVHFPSITSIISKKVHDSDRALSFATSVAGSHFGWVSCLYCDIGRDVAGSHFGWVSCLYCDYCDIGRWFTLRVGFLSLLRLLRHRSLVHTSGGFPVFIATSVAGSHFGWVSCLSGSRPAVLCSHSVTALSDVKMVGGKNVISVS